ncbi:hypothetical protein JCM8547_002611 [Rhodosporidiobolus lusitaniae]
MPFCPRLEQNARAVVVLVCRPVTFLMAVVLSVLSLVVSSFFSVTGIAPPSCPHSVCSEDEPRTRPRPAPPAQAIPSAPEPPKRTPLEFVVAAFSRPATRPPPARRKSTRAVGFDVHELDQLAEAREEEEELEREEAEAARAGRLSREEAQRASSPDLFAPSLTPDGGSEVDTDGASEVDTLEDDRVGPLSAKEKGKGLSIFTSFTFRRSASGSSSKHASSPISSSPDELSKPASPASSIHSGSSTSKAQCPISRRKRAATCASTSRPSLPSIVAPPPRRQASNPGPPSPTHSLDQLISSGSSSSSSTSTAPSSLFSNAPLTVFPLSSPPLSGNTNPSSVPGRKRSTSSFFRSPFRSLSPLSRSPITTPEPSPPPSPTLGPPTSSGLGRVSSFSKKNRTRAKSPVPTVRIQDPPELRRRVSDGQGPDLSGASGLSIR